VAAPFKNHSFVYLLQDKTNYLRNRPVNRGIFGRDFETGLSGLIGENASRVSISLLVGAFQRHAVILV